MEKELSKHPIALTDAELVQLAREDDGYAFHLLMESYQVMAACIALRMISNEETAHDLVRLEIVVSEDAVL